jgi:hypothetical protein
MLQMLVALMTLEMLPVFVELQLLVFLELAFLELAFLELAFLELEFLELVFLELVFLELVFLELQLLLALDAHVELAPEVRPRAPEAANATEASGQQ